MKRFLLLLLITLSLGAQAQTYNNEWIDYSKTYYKFNVGYTGLYRIPQPVLTAGGLGSINADHFQLWRNGKQVPIYTSVQGQALGSSDYIEFWGEMNDGKPDNALYREPLSQINDKWSLQTDTSAYFLTVNTAGNNLRLLPAANNVATNTLAPEPYFMHVAGNYWRQKINQGRTELVGDSYTFSSSYDIGEGHTSNDIANGAILSFTATALNPYTGAGAPQPTIRVNAAGWALNPRYFNVKVNGDSVFSQVLDYYDWAKPVFPINVSRIASGTAQIDIVNTSTVPFDRMVVGVAELTYPRTFNFGGASNFNFELPANAAGNYLEISAFSYAGPAPVLYDLTNGKRYVADNSTPSLLKFVLLPSAVNRKLVLVSEDLGNILVISSLTSRTFVNYSIAANQGNYLIITNQVLTAGPNGTNPVEDYRAYRSSPAGGAFNAKVYMIDQLVDQFAFGIKMHPLSIQNFIRWARAKYSMPLKDVLLLGRAVTYDQFRGYESNPDISRICMVPTFGYPASDNLLTAEPQSSMPLTPIGRIAAINAAEINIYLQKLKEYDLAAKTSSPIIADKSWMKDVVHVAGASDDGLNDILVDLLNNYAKVAKDTLFGANVYSFSKNSANTVEQLNSAQLTSLFNNGISLLTYFGHSSSTTLEFNLDNPLNYNNPGKYPVFIVMGCNAGNYYNFTTNRFSTKESLSEKYVLAPQRGSIAFLASTHLGIVHYLDMYNTWTYRSLSGPLYGKTLGEIMDESIRRIFIQNSQNDFYARFQCEQFSLHGDPAIRLYNFDKPDYAIEDQLVRVSPSIITVAENKFTVNIKVMNLGRAPNKDIVVQTKRTFPDLSTQIIRRDTIKGVRYIDSLKFDIPLVATRDRGLNKLTITVDPENVVDELYETNNSITKDVIIYDNEARPIFPYAYSIVSKQDIKLSASTADPFHFRQDYIMQMDTTELFNSSLKITRVTPADGGVLEFTPGITFTDNTVYYWRVGPKPITNADTIWNTTSFIYLANSEAGFNQSHFYQQSKITGQRIEIDSASRAWKYKLVIKNIFVRLGSYVTSGASQSLALNVSVDGDHKTGLTAWFQSLVFNVFDPKTFNLMENEVVTAPVGFPDQLGAGLYNSVAPINLAQSEPMIYNFEYRYTDPAKRQNAMLFMKDVIPDGSYVVVRSFMLDSTVFGSGPTFPQSFAPGWKTDQSIYGVGNTMYDYLKNNAGFADLDSFNKSRNWALIYKKNDPTFTPKWVFTENTLDNTTLSVNCTALDSLGIMTSPLLGPAKAWHHLKWKGRSEELTAGDNPVMRVVGVNKTGDELPLITDLDLSKQDFDISSIDASAYPYLKLQMRNPDSITYTPYQLDYWRVTYDPVPEGGVSPDFTFKFKDTVEVGEPASFKMAFKNVSDLKFDSIRVKISVIDQNNLQHLVLNKKLKPLLVGDTVSINHTLNTDDLSGNNQVYFEFNPDDDQPEQQHFNNFAFHSLFVKGDSLGPLLDVTFDGSHILNKDIVSSKPEIMIKLKDEAKWMVLNDTSVASVKVRYPNGTVRDFYFNNNNDTLQFIPVGQAPSTDNTATVNFNPYFTQDGEYELRVTGKDRSENSAGVINYRVSFQVINKPMISNMLNYPNPFTTSTAFVFTLTGSEVPQNLRIQIMTITGKIVRDITKDELGPLHIGRNITEFKWDGTDQYGQKLANGIYLYRVITNLNGKALDKYKSTQTNNVDNTDKFFNNGYGKMYLMR